MSGDIYTIPEPTEDTYENLRGSGPENFLSSSSTTTTLRGRLKKYLVKAVAACVVLLLVAVIIVLVVSIHSANEQLRVQRIQLDSMDKNLTLIQSNYNLLQSKYNNQINAGKQFFSGWTRFGSNRYKRFTDKMTWEEARKQCKKMGEDCDLVVINSKEEQEFIQGLSPDSSSWIGLRREEGKWTWVDKTPLTTGYWRSGYPDNTHSQWNCAAYWHQDGNWTNAQCEPTETYHNPNRKAWICEM